MLYAEIMRFDSCYRTSIVRYAEVGEKYQTHKHGHQLIDAVSLASNSERVSLGHSNRRKNRTYVLYGSCRIRILKITF